MLHRYPPLHKRTLFTDSIRAAARNVPIHRTFLFFHTSPLSIVQQRGVKRGWMFHLHDEGGIKSTGAQQGRLKYQYRNSPEIPSHRRIFLVYWTVR
jgi:hypothetical protein